MPQDSVAAAGTPVARPDLVLITIDTLRADALGFAGNSDVATPQLDKLAAGGRVYVDAHAHNVVTLPSHVNLLTGLYPFQHGVRDNSGFRLPDDVPTLATELSAAGYATGAFVGAFPLDRRFGLGRGFEVYDDRTPRGSDPAAFVIPERRGDEVVAAAGAWWEKSAARARFLWVHLYDPHASYDPPEPWKSRYAHRPYLGEVAAVDAFLEPLLRPFLAGQARPALVAVTADHGESLGEHGEMTHGLFAYEATLKIPLVLWGVGVEPGRDARAARHVDLAPTLLAAAGITPKRRLPGRSLLDPPVDGWSYFEALSTQLNRGWAPLRGVANGGRKWIELPLPELYDLATDRNERTNLADSRPAEVVDLRRLLPTESEWPPRASAKASGEEAASLRALGYAVGAVAPKSSYGPEDDPKRLIALDRKLHETIDLYSRGRYAEAVARAREIIAIRPQMAEAYEHAALALRQLERQEEAIVLLQEGLTRAEGRSALTRQLGMTLAELGRSEEAVAILAPLESEGDPESLRALATALADAGEGERALRVLALARRAAPGDPQIDEAEGVIELRGGDAAGARRALERALAANDRLPGAWNTLGVALYGLEGPRAALSAWRRAVELDASQFDALYNLGLVAASLGERAEAKRALELYVATAPAVRFATEIAKARSVLVELGP